jgi:hypothetical protein
MFVDKVCHKIMMRHNESVVVGGFEIRSVKSILRITRGRENK